MQRTAQEKGIDLQRIRRQVAFDRLLARFFTQPETPFFLKGGYPMELRLSTARATKDIDLTYLPFAVFSFVDGCHLKPLVSFGLSGWMMRVRLFFTAPSLHREL